MKDTVSIIMPSYNTGRFIEESIQSVIDQTYQKWELIVVDDCSTDNTDEIMRRYRDCRIKYLKNTRNRGAAVSRNKALRYASGTWVAFLDSDDVWCVDKLEKQLEFMKLNRIDFSYTKYDEIDEKSNNLGVTVGGPQKITKLGMYNYCWPGCLTVMYNQKKIGLIQVENICKNNDYAMWLQIIENAPCYLFNESLARYRKREGSISNHSYLRLLRYHYILFRLHKGIFFSVWLTILNIIFGLVKKLVYRKST